MNKQLRSQAAKQLSFLPEISLSSYPLTFLSSFKRSAFTLAETLIVLAIIGVVAMLTITKVVTNYQDSVKIVKLKKMYSIILQAHKLVIDDLGEYYWKKVNTLNSNGWDTSKQPKIADKFAEKLGNVRYCGKMGWVGQISEKNCKNEAKTFLGLNGTVAGSYGYINRYLYIMPDGSHIAIKFSSGTWTLINKKVAAVITVDINGYKGPNQAGNDRFYFLLMENNPNIIPNYFTGQSGEGLNMDLNTDVSTNFDITTQTDCTRSGYGFSCAYAIINNGWQMPPNYHKK